MDDPASDGAPRLERDREVSGFIAIQDERTGQLAAPVDEVETIAARGYAVDREPRGIRGDLLRVLEDVEQVDLDPTEQGPTVEIKDRASSRPAGVGLEFEGNLLRPPVRD